MFDLEVRLTFTRNLTYSVYPELAEIELSRFVYRSMARHHIRTMIYVLIQIMLVIVVLRHLCVMLIQFQLCRDPLGQGWGHIMESKFSWEKRSIKKSCKKSQQLNSGRAKMSDVTHGPLVPPYILKIYGCVILPVYLCYRVFIFCKHGQKRDKIGEIPTLCCTCSHS